MDTAQRTTQSDFDLKAGTEGMKWLQKHLPFSEPFTVWKKRDLLRAIEANYCTDADVQIHTNTTAEEYQEWPNQIAKTLEKRQKSAERRGQNIVNVPLLAGKAITAPVSNPEDEIGKSIKTAEELDAHYTDIHGKQPRREGWQESFDQS